MTDGLLGKVLANENISNITKRNYADRVRVLEKHAEKSIDYIVLHPDKYIPLIRKVYPNPTSTKAYLTTVISLFRHNPDFKESHKTVYEKWSNAFKEADTKVTERYEANSPSERQAIGYVPYAKIIEERDKLPAGSVERLLLGFYTHIRPLRAEYCRIALYKNAVPRDAEPNYIVMRKQNMKMVIAHFKTRKAYDTIEIDLPEPLVKDLDSSLKEMPREWLFINQKGEPYTQAAYSMWTSRTFMKLFNKPLTVSLIRHSFINTLDFNKLSIAEKRAIAKDMAHNIETQDKYRLIFN
jgi:hypothetical protein